MKDDNFKRIDVPLNWVEIDNTIIGLRILRKAELMSNEFSTKLLEHLEPYSMKAKEEH